MDCMLVVDKQAHEQCTRRCIQERFHYAYGVGLACAIPRKVGISRDCLKRIAANKVPADEAQAWEPGASTHGHIDFA